LLRGAPADEWSCDRSGSLRIDPAANFGFNSPSTNGPGIPGAIGGCRQSWGQSEGGLSRGHDPNRRLSKRKKDELDLIRLAEAYPELKSLYLSQLREQLDRG